MEKRSYVLVREIEPANKPPSSPVRQTRFTPSKARETSQQSSGERTECAKDGWPRRFGLVTHLPDSPRDTRNSFRKK